MRAVGCRNHCSNFRGSAPIAVKRNKPLRDSIATVAREHGCMYHICTPQCQTQFGFGEQFVGRNRHAAGLFDGIAGGRYTCDAVAMDTGEVWALRYDTLLAACTRQPELLKLLHSGHAYACLKKLRDEARYDDLNELVAQIERDAASARTYLTSLQRDQA